MFSFANNKNASIGPTAIEFALTTPAKIGLTFIALFTSRVLSFHFRSLPISRLDLISLHGYLLLQLISVPPNLTRKAVYATVSGFASSKHSLREREKGESEKGESERKKSEHSHKKVSTDK